MKKRAFENAVHGVFLVLGLITVGCVLLISIYLIVAGIPAIRETLFAEAQRIRDLLGQAKTVAETPVTFEAPASRDSSSQTPRFEPEFNLTDLDDTF